MGGISLRFLRSRSWSAVTSASCRTCCCNSRWLIAILPRSSKRPLQGRLDLGRRHLFVDDDANGLVIPVGQHDLGAEVLLLADGEGDRFAGRHRDLEAADVAGRFPRLVLAGQLEVGAVGMLDQHDAVHVVAVGDGVGLALLDLGGRVQNALDDLDGGDAAIIGVGHGMDFGAQVDGVAEQATFVLLQIGDASVAGIGAALVDRDRSLRQMHARRVLEHQAEEREFGVRVFVVDADTLSLDVLTDDGQQSGLLPRQADGVVDGVLEVVAQL